MGQCSWNRRAPPPQRPRRSPALVALPSAPKHPQALPSARNRSLPGRNRWAPPRSASGAPQRSKRGPAHRSLPKLPLSVFGLPQAPQSAPRAQVFPCAPKRRRGASPLRCAPRLPRSTAAHLSRRRADHMMRVPGWVGGFTPPWELPRQRLKPNTLMNPKP